MWSGRNAARWTLAAIMLLITCPCFADDGYFAAVNLKTAISIFTLTVLAIAIVVLRQYLEAKSAKKKALNELYAKISELHARNQELSQKLANEINDCLDTIQGDRCWEALGIIKHTAAEVFQETEEVLSHALEMGKCYPDAAYDYMRGRFNLGRYHELTKAVQAEKEIFTRAQAEAPEQLDELNKKYQAFLNQLSAKEEDLISGILANVSNFIGEADYELTDSRPDPFEAMHRIARGEAELQSARARISGLMSMYSANQEKALASLSEVDALVELAEPALESLEVLARDYPQSVWGDLVQSTNSVLSELEENRRDIKQAEVENGKCTKESINTAERYLSAIADSLEVLRGVVEKPTQRIHELETARDAIHKLLTSLKEEADRAEAFLPRESVSDETKERITQALSLEAIARERTQDKGKQNWIAIRLACEDALIALEEAVAGAKKDIIQNEDTEGRLIRQPNSH
jgi:cell division protein FtsB